MSSTESTTPGTEYLILERRGVESPADAGERQTNPYWVERETRYARSAKDAIAAYVKSDGNRGGHFVAVPTRSFVEIDVETETQTRLVFK